jgi:DNA gyrase/topoisomerase IV subunit B
MGLNGIKSQFLQSGVLKIDLEMIQLERVKTKVLCGVQMCQQLITILFKDLGQLNPKMLYKYQLHPANRVLWILSIQDKERFAKVLKKSLSNMPISWLL